MRLLYLNPTAAMGGAERVLLDLLGLLRDARPTWPVGLIVGNDGPLAADARRLGVETVILPYPRDFAQLGDYGLANPTTWAKFAGRAFRGSLSTLRYVRRLRRVIAEFRPDVVHSNGIKMHLLGAIAKPANTALVWHFHDYPSGRPLTGRLVRVLRRRCDAVIAVSDSVAVDIRTVVGKHMDLRTIGNSVDLGRFGANGPRLDLDALSGLAHSPPSVLRIGLVATFARWKGHILFLDMVKALSATESVRGYVVGGPVYETQASQISMDELRAAVAERGLSETVGLTGFVSDSAAALRSLDIVVHASTAREPFGLVIAEAMAAGRAVVTSDVGGIAEFVLDEHTGLTYSAGSVTDMTRQVRRLVHDTGLRQRLGKAAEDAARLRFDPARLAAQVLDLYTRFDRALAA